MQKNNTIWTLMRWLLKSTDNIAHGDDMTKGAQMKAIACN